MNRTIPFRDQDHEEHDFDNRAESGFHDNTKDPRDLARKLLACEADQVGDGDSDVVEDEDGDVLVITKRQF
jgi:hypothetical protein